MYKLKPCPFCGGEAELVNAIGNDYYRSDQHIVCNARCKDCGVETTGSVAEDHTFAYVEQAIEKWNRRAHENQESESL